MPEIVLPSFGFSNDLRGRILAEYVRYLIKACKAVGLPWAMVEYSERELRQALDEAEIDIRAMFARRSVTDGIAPGKIAGVLAFRLSRFKIVHVREGGREHPHLHFVQELAAVLLVRGLIVQAPVPAHSIIELAYQLSRRHANQEAAGLLFDSVIEPQAA